MFPHCVMVTPREFLSFSSASERRKFVFKTGKKCLYGEGSSAKRDRSDARQEEAGSGPRGSFFTCRTFLLLDSPGDGGLYSESVLGGSFIEPTPVKPGPALSSDVTPRKGKAEFERRSPYVSLGFNNSPLVRF